MLHESSDTAAFTGFLVSGADVLESGTAHFFVRGLYRLNSRL